MDKGKINALRMERQGLSRKVNEEEYRELYRDLQPGQNVYWNGFGQPPTLSFRAAFDDLEFNRRRQMEHQLVKGRFAGGNLGWIVPEDMELFAGAYRKPLKSPGEVPLLLLERIQREGPLTIQQMKEATGLLVKAITPALHKLQEAFLVYEDQYDGGWDRGWCRFGEAFPEVDLDRYSRVEAAGILLERFARRLVWFDLGMAKNFYRLPERDLRQAAEIQRAKGVLVSVEGGYMLASDQAFLEDYRPEPMGFIYPLHRNDVLYKVWEPEWKALAQKLTEGLEYDHEPLQYLLIDGAVRGAVVGHFRNGPYDLNDVVLDSPELESRREEILAAVEEVNFGRSPQRFAGASVDA